MSVHTFHPDSHEHGLADDCPRCAEHASHPEQSLDAPNLVALVQRIQGNLPPRSENEAEAMRNMSTSRLLAPHGTPSREPRR